MKWENLLKKQWTEDDYDHPLIKKLFIGFKKIAQINKINPDPELKALKLFEDVCSNYEISMYEDSPVTLLVKLPNTSLTAHLLDRTIIKKILMKKYPEVYIRLKGEKCPICVKTPRGATLPFFDYLVSMVGLAASDGRGTDIEAFNLANDLIEGGVEWDLILYSPVISNMGWFNEIAKKYRNSDKLDFILETLVKYNPRYRGHLLAEIKFIEGYNR